MEPKDLSAYIAALSKDYLYPKTPKVVNHFEDLFLRLLRYIIDFLDSLHIKIPYPTHENMMTMYMMLAVFIVAFIAISLMVIVLIRSVQQNTVRISSRTLVDANLEPILDSSSWLNIAEELASEKNYRSACRAVFLSTLLVLDEMTIAKFVTALSNYEYLYRIVRHKELHAKVRELANIVDLIWFGNHEANASSYQSCLSLHSAVKAEAEDIIRRRQFNGK
ncbi:MAG: DUF4129 domain-containing protein [Candidatus Obscuribacterales bacterium]|nr:DUF4129 domain-containing protein [Candidatus Obscuribacterales bacterium]